MADQKLKSAIEANYLEPGQVEVEVKEWGTTLYADPLTLAQKSKQWTWQTTPGEGRLITFAKMIVMLAKNKDGTQAFDQTDMDMLTNRADPDVVSRVSNELSRVPEIEDLKND